MDPALQHLLIGLGGGACAGRLYVLWDHRRKRCDRPKPAFSLQEGPMMQELLHGFKSHEKELEALRQGASAQVERQGQLQRQIEALSGRIASLEADVSALRKAATDAPREFTALQAGLVALSREVEAVERRCMEQFNKNADASDDALNTVLGAVDERLASMQQFIVQAAQAAQAQRRPEQVPLPPLPPQAPRAPQRPAVSPRPGGQSSSPNPGSWQRPAPPSPMAGQWGAL